MDKKEALLVLIQHSMFIPEKVKLELIEKIDQMTDEQINDIGRFLALEKKKSIEGSDEMISYIEKILEEK